MRVRPCTPPDARHAAPVTAAAAAAAACPVLPPPLPAAGCAPITTLFRRVPAWGDYAEALAVLRLGQPATALHFVQAGPRDDAPAFVAVGDAAGALHLFTPGGELAAQHSTGEGAGYLWACRRRMLVGQAIPWACRPHNQPSPPPDAGAASPVTALGSYRLSRNTTVLLTGHRSGQVRLHALLAPARGVEPSISLLAALAPEALLCGADAASCGGQGGGTCAAAATGVGQACAPITALHASPRGFPATTTITSVDALGRLAVMKHRDGGGELPAACCLP